MAQVHPHRLTLALIKAAQHCRLQRSTVTGISTDADGAVSGTGSRTLCQDIAHLGLLLPLKLVQGPCILGQHVPDC